MSEGPYTTITVTEYAHLKDVILALRTALQKTRQYLEKGKVKEALELAKKDY